MILRNKKTGRIVCPLILDSADDTIFLANSLKELVEEWEDYESFEDDPTSMHELIISVNELIDEIKGESI